MGDVVDALPVLVWDSRAQRLVQLDSSAVVRENKMTFTIRNCQWRKIVQQGEHAFFCGYVAYKMWKPNPSTICVVEWPAPEGSHQLPSYIWCVRFEIAPDAPDSQLPLVPNIGALGMPVAFGRRVLWPLEPDHAKDVFLKFEAENPQQTLMTMLPHNHVENHQHYPFPWACHPKASKKPLVISSFWERIFLASLRPLDWLGDGTREGRRATYLELPRDQLSRHDHCAKLDLQIKTMIKQHGWRPSHVRPFNRLSDDLIHEFIKDLATEYVQTPAYGGHRNWTALRAVCRSFRDAADAAAVEFVERVYSRIRSVEDFEDEYDITRLRDAVIPSGLDLWWFCVAYKHGVMAGHTSRPALLCYMRARSGKDWRELPPKPISAPPQPRADGSMVCMYFRHGPTRDEVALRQQQRTHGTRSKAPMCPGVTLKLKVEPWQVKMMGMRSWDKCSESSV
jgi:hypothetical protein